MEKPIHVRILGREYRLLVQEEHEGVTREIAAYVNAKMTAFRKAHPEQPELTTAVIVALALGEDLFEAWEERDALRAQVDREAAGLVAAIDAALGENTEAHVAAPASPEPHADGTEAAPGGAEPGASTDDPEAVLD